MTFFKFYILIMALGFLRILIFGKNKSEDDINIYKVLGEFIAYSIVIYITYQMLIYSGPDFIELVKGVI